MVVEKANPFSFSKAQEITDEEGLTEIETSDWVDVKPPYTESISVLKDLIDGTNVDIRNKQGVIESKFLRDHGDEVISLDRFNTHQLNLSVFQIPMRGQVQDHTQIIEIPAAYQDMYLSAMMMVDIDDDGDLDLVMKFKDELQNEQILVSHNAENTSKSGNMFYSLCRYIESESA